MSTYRDFDRSLDQALEEHKARVAVAERNAEAMKRGYIVEQTAISRQLMMAKVEALKEARARGYQEEVSNDGHGQQEHEAQRHVEHAERDQAQGLEDATCAAGGEPNEVTDGDRAMYYAATGMLPDA